jgi:hypothetical protein
MYKPPTLRELLALPLYKSYFKKIPVEPTPGPLNNPWQVWAYNAETERWASRLCDSYPTAYDVARKLYPNAVYEDIVIVSRSMLHNIPRALRLAQPWDPYRYDWCKRCRRPTIFRYTEKPHRALKNAPAITADDPVRCYYCGVRKCFAGQELSL